MSPSRCGLETLESVPCDGYRRDKIVFDTEDTMLVPAYLLVPTGGKWPRPAPAVLAAHGHGPGSREAVGLEHTDTPNADYAHQLGLRGYVVLAVLTFAVSVNGSTGTPRTTTRATRISSTPRWRGEPAGPERLGPLACP